jgi:hypothetical protein
MHRSVLMLQSRDIAMARKSIGRLSPQDLEILFTLWHDLYRPRENIESAD